MNSKTKKGFTLIELLIVIAMIGILAGIILVATSISRGKAADAAIISSANSLMKAAMVDSSVSNVYTAWVANPYTYDTNSCDNVDYAGISQPLRDSVRAACHSILARNSSGYGAAGPLYQNLQNWTGPQFTLMVWLPQAQVYYCINSIGKSSTALLADGSGCGGLVNQWKCSGCTGDTAQ